LINVSKIFLLFSGKLLASLVATAVEASNERVVARDGTSNNLDNTSNRMQNPKIKSLK
jgi:hypothetical protein